MSTKSDGRTIEIDDAQNHVICLLALRTGLMVVRSPGGRLPDMTVVETTLVASMDAAALRQFLSVVAFAFATKLVSTDHLARAGRYLEREHQRRDEDR
ncbi:hypothetical protein [Lacunimicrobium album]